MKQNVAQYPLHHVAYSSVRFEVATSNHLGDVITRKQMIQPLILTLGSRSHKMLLRNFYIMCHIHLQGLRLIHPIIKEELHFQEIHYSTFDLDLWVKVTQSVAQYPIHHVAYSPARL